MFAGVYFAAALAHSGADAVKYAHQEFYETPIGSFHYETVGAVCHAEHIIVGTVTSSAAYWKPYFGGDGAILNHDIHTLVTMTVDLDLHGFGAESLTFDVRGGSLDGQSKPFVGSVPLPEVGRQFAVAFNVHKRGTLSYPMGYKAVRRAFRVPEGTVLPPRPTVLKELNKVCVLP